MKLTIIPTSGSLLGRRLEFQDIPVVRIGRNRENHCVFDAPEERMVSGFHAEIHILSDKVEVIDLESTNGLLVDGSAVRRAALTPGQTIQLGTDGPVFTVEFPGSSKSSAPLKTIRSPAAPKKYGERTVGMLIQQALAQANLFRSKGAPKTTAYLRALVERQMSGVSSKARKTVLAAVLVLLAAGLALGYYLYQNRSVQVFQTTHVNYGDAVGSSIAAANRYTIFLLAGVRREGGELQGFCTAFAVTSDILATNAHCFKTAREQFQGILALMNGAPANRYNILELLPHPEYAEGRVSPDVGLVRLRGQLTQRVTLASQAELAQTGPGMPVFLYGFPGRLNRVDAPEATFIKGEIGRVTRFDQQVGDFESNTLLQHSAFSSGGTSGSPMFNSQGHVVGINAGGYSEDGQALVGYNFGVRIDMIEDLLAQMDKR